jgi:hypothetical protein
MNGGTTFTCTFCEHSVTTLDFNSTTGNCRTQAAAVINQHAVLLHGVGFVPLCQCMGTCIFLGVRMSSCVALDLGSTRRIEDLMWQSMVPELGDDSPQISAARN